MADPGGGSGESGPPLSDLTPTTLWLKFLQWQDRVSRSFLMKRVWYFPTKLNARDIQKCNCFWVPSLLMICSPLLAKQCFPRQQRPAFTDWETRGHLYFLSWLTIMATTADNHVFSTNQIQCNWKWNSNGIEAEAEAMEFESGERCFMPLYFHFLRNVTDCGLDKMRVRSKHLYVCCFSWAFWFWCRSLSGRSSFKWCYGR